MENHLFCSWFDNVYMSMKYGESAYIDSMYYLFDTSFNNIRALGRELLWS